MEDADRRQLRIKRQQICQAIAVAWGEYPQSQGLNDEMAEGYKVRGPIGYKIGILDSK